MPWYNPLSWQDKYRSERDANIQAEGDAAAEWLQNLESDLDSMPSDALAAMWQVVTGKQEIDFFHEALRDARVGESMARKYEAIMRDSDKKLLKDLLRQRI